MEKIIVQGYEVLVGWDSGDQIYVAQCPILPGCMAHGSTFDEAVNEIKTAIKEHLELAEELKRPILAALQVYT